MWMAQVLAAPPQTAAKLWKSWVTHREQQPAQILHEVRFRHMLPTPATIGAQTALAEHCRVPGGSGLPAVIRCLTILRKPLCCRRSMWRGSCRFLPRALTLCGIFEPVANAIVLTL